MGSMIHQAGYIYYFTRKLCRLDHKIRHVHKEAKEYAHKHRSARTVEERQTYQRRLERAVKNYHHLMDERRKVHGKIHEHVAGLARMMKLEEHLKL